MFWVLFAFASALLTSAEDVLNKKLVAKVDEYVAGAVAATAGALVCLAALFLTGVPQIQQDFYWGFAVNLVFLATATILYLKALKLTDASLAIPLLALTPALLLGVAPAITGEKISLQGIAGVLLVAAGTYFLSLDLKTRDWLQPFKKIWGDAGMKCMLVVAVLYCVTATAFKVMIVNSNAIFSAAAIMAGLMVFYWAVVLADADKRRQVKPALSNGALSGLSRGFSEIAIATALGLGITPYVIAIKRLSIPATVALSKRFLGEENVKQRLMASFVMIAGIALIVLS